VNSADLRSKKFADADVDWQDIANLVILALS